MKDLEMISKLGLKFERNISFQRPLSHFHGTYDRNIKMILNEGSLGKWV
jgi:hypothetical protein